MLSTRDSIRFTAKEIRKKRELGLVLDQVKTRADLTEVLVFWVEALVEKRPELLEKLIGKLK